MAKTKICSSTEFCALILSNHRDFIFPKWDIGKKCNLTLTWAHLPIPWPLDWPLLVYPLTLTHVTLESWPWTLHVSLSNEALNHIFFTWRPWPLNFRLTLTHVTFNLDPCDVWPWSMWPLTFNTCKPVRPKITFLTWWTWPLTYDPDFQGRPWSLPRPRPDEISWA